MADSKLTALTANTTPALSDIIYMVDDPGGSPLSQKITIQNLRGGYVVPAACAASNPADGTSYYFGSLFSNALSTTAVIAPCLIPRAGTITAVGLWVKVLGTTPSNQQSTVSLRKNNTSNTTITSTLDISPTAANIMTTGLSVAMTTSDYFEILWVTPTWTTNPTNVLLAAFVYVS